MWNLVGHPFTLACGALLIVNDHLLKQAYPGLLTGKLSDIAGVAMVAMVLSAFAGRSLGVGLTAVAFVALKLSPAAAHVAAPVLGGVTRTDPSDLLAVAVLFPTWWVAGFAARQPTRPGRIVSGSLLPVLNAIVAVSATTATSCGPRPAVVQVTNEAGVFFAAINLDEGNPNWAERTADETTWRSSDGPRTRPPSTAPYELHVDIPAQGPTTACADNQCWAVRDGRAVYSQLDDGNWEADLQLSDAEYEAISTGCTGAHQGILGSITALNGARGPVVIASLGAEGVLERSADGVWIRSRVLSAPPIPATELERQFTRSALYGGFVMAVLLVLMGRRWPSLPLGLAIVGTGSVSTIMAIGLAQFMTPTTMDPDRISAWISPIGLGVTMICAVAAARHRPPESHPRPSFPWPPPTPR